MICPNCRTNHKHKTGMACSCGYRFLLDPKIDGMSDGRFLAIVRRASANDTYHYTKEQLYAAYARVQYRSPKILAVGSALSAVITLLIWFAVPGSIDFALFAALVTIIFFAAAVMRSVAGAPSRTDWNRILAKWPRSGRGDALAKMITEPRLRQPPPDWREPDIYEYGVERILIVERDVLVDLLVLNGFHADQRTLVLSETGYPEYLAPHARRCLEESPELPVLLLHDATRHGVGMKERVQASSRLPLTERPLKDLGLFPADIQRMIQLRFLGARARGFELPVDALLYAALAADLAECLAQDVALGALIEQKRKDASDATGFG